MRQSHQVVKPGDSQQLAPPSTEGEFAARVLELWKDGEDPITVVETLRVHPRFVKEVLKEYDELLNDWKKSSEVEKPSPAPSEPATPRLPKSDEKVV